MDSWRCRGLSWGLDNEGAQGRAREEEARCRSGDKRRWTEAADSGVALGNRECAGAGTMRVGCAAGGLGMGDAVGLTLAGSRAVSGSRVGRRQDQTATLGRSLEG